MNLLIVMKPLLGLYYGYLQLCVRSGMSPDNSAADHVFPLFKRKFLFQSVYLQVTINDKKCENLFRPDIYFSHMISRIQNQEM